MGFERIDERVTLSINTYSMAAPQTNILDLLRQVAPSAALVGPNRNLFETAYLYRVAPNELPAAVALLQSHVSPVVSVMLAECELALCLDFYQHPDEEQGGWSKTAVGALVHATKYGGQGRLAGPQLAEQVINFVKAHPVLSKVDAVAAVPSSQSIGAAERGLAYGVAKYLADALGVSLVALSRSARTEHPQKNVRDGDPEANQAGTMEASLQVAQRRVLIIDDLMRHGSTVREAARALRAAGADRVYSLTLAKEHTGTRGYRF